MKVMLLLVYSERRSILGRLREEETQSLCELNLTGVSLYIVVVDIVVART